MSSNITGTPDHRGVKSPGGIGASDWLESTLQDWDTVFKASERYPTIHLGNLDFITLFDWTTTVSLLEKALSSCPSIEYFGINLLASNEHSILTPQAYKKAKQTINPENSLGYKHSHRIYQLAGFLESLGTSAVLNQGFRGIIGYPNVGTDYAAFRSHYSGWEGSETVVMPLQRIETKDHAREFLDDKRLANWRARMSDKFRDSPLFLYEELWRVFCHELSANIFDHAKCAGYLAGRIVEPHSKSGKLLQWVQDSYPHSFHEIINAARGGILELCVSDAGLGLTSTLEEAYRKRAPSTDSQPLDPNKILAFAFDEIGTCKPTDRCWATARHALGRILLIITKYGGVLRVRSGISEVSYVSTGSSFERFPNHLGFKPTESRNLPFYLPGTHFQLLVPLYPLESRNQSTYKNVFATLPKGFQADLRHVTGHLIPLREQIDRILDRRKSRHIDGAPLSTFDESDPTDFNDACEELVRNIIKERPPTEPLVLDFSDLNWTSYQFETLLVRFQNILLSRPALLVEMLPSLAKLVVELVDLATPLPERDDEKGSTFLEAYHAIHVHLLGVDRDGCRYVFGVKEPYRSILINLSRQPLTKEAMQKLPGIHAPELSAILNNINPLFRKNPKGEWETVWNDLQINREACRAMTRHFEETATVCQAWRGRKNKRPDDRDESKMAFNLPWSNKWMTEFFESSRILARQRYADEAAQRLIYRLEIGLSIAGKKISDVTVLACATAPSNLLAFAIHRWWPVERPTIADLGPYMMLNPQGVLPSLASAPGGYVIIQDVLDTGIVSKRLIDLLHNQDKDVYCVLSLVRLVEDPTLVGYTSPTDGWRETTDNHNNVPMHAMVNMQRPAKYNIQSGTRSSHQWVEPRTLRPFSYRLLRREVEDKLPVVKRPRATLFHPSHPKIVRSGHYVYGERHYPVALDIKTALDKSSEIGIEIQEWIVDVCTNSSRKEVKWESERGRALSGDVTIVLMPLHSRIHYVWPDIEELLAQRERRVICLYLDATLFLGYGAAYRLPLQLDDLIRRAAEQIFSLRINSRLDPPITPDAIHGAQLRILILDDAMVRARTAETILAEISRVVEKAKEGILIAQKKIIGRADTRNIEDIIQNIQPIQWVRYFVVFSQMGHARHTHWSDLTTTGMAPGIPFVFEAHSWIVGMPSYGETDCPICKRQRRLQHFSDSNRAANSFDVIRWSKFEFAHLQPTALDAPLSDVSSSALDNAEESVNEYTDSITGFTRPHLHSRNLVINILKEPKNKFDFQVKSLDLAILRFYEITYLSYPPRDIIEALEANTPFPKQYCSERESKHFEDYRWCVLEWCINNWPRLIADSSRDAFFSQLQREISINSPLVERIFEGISLHHEDHFVANFVVDTLVNLRDLECQRNDENESNFEENNDKIYNVSQIRITIHRALSIFLLSIPRNALKSFPVNGHRVDLIDFTENLAGSLKTQPLFGGQITYLSLLHLLVSSPGKHADPCWVLRVLSETLFRGRNPDDPVQGGHRMLPFYLTRISGDGASREDVSLLLSALGQFVAALVEIRLFDHALEVETITVLSKDVITWLSSPDIDKLISDCECPDCVSELIDELSTEGRFCIQFDNIFRQKVSDIQNGLEERYLDLQVINKYSFKFISDEEVLDWRVLTHVKSLTDYIVNLTSDNITVCEGGLITCVSVHRHHLSHSTDQLRFRILTSIADPKTAEQRVSGGRNHDSEVSILKSYGVILTDEWSFPNKTEIDNGYRSCYEFYVPAGYIPRIRRKE